jgi:hypothetical protein
MGCFSFQIIRFWNKRSSLVEVELNLDSDSSGELFTKIKKAIGKSPKVISLEIVGTGNISQDMALVIWDLVHDAKKTGVRFITKARSSLYDGSLLLLLLGDARTVRSTGFFQIDSLNRLENKDWSEFESRKPSCIDIPAWVTNYRQVFQIMNQYIPAEELADKRIPLVKLGEYGLLNNIQEEKSFQSLFYPLETKNMTNKTVGNIN